MERVCLAHPAILKNSNTAFRVLVIMAKVAHDDEPKYWGGWELLALNLGYDPSDRNGQRVVARAIAVLIDDGLIKPTVDRYGRRVVYELHLPRLT